MRDAMIVAGGAGRRLWPLTATRPKPLVAFCDAPFLEGVVRRLAAIGIDRVLLVVGADPSPFEVLRPVAAALGVELEAVPEPEPLDTAGGVRAALDRVRGAFLVLNGDILTDVDLAAVAEDHERSGADASLVLTRVRDTSSYGVCVREGTRIVGFVEKPTPGSLPGQDTVNAGTYVLDPSVLEGFAPGPLSFEREVFPQLLERGAHLHGIVSDAVWADLGTPQRYLEGHRAALDGAVAWPALAEIPADGAGIRRGDGAQVEPGARVVGPVLLGAGSHLAAGARVGPHVVLGAGSRVEPGAEVRDSVLGRRTVIGADARLAAVVTGEDVTIGARTRAIDGAVLGDGTAVDAGTDLAAGSTRPGAA